MDIGYAMKSTAELKFLLTLLGCKAYRSLLGASCFKSFKGKSKICQDLGERGWIDYSREILSVKLLPAGKALLALDAESLPIDVQSLQILGKIAEKSGKAALKDIRVSKIKTAEKQEILSKLADRGFVELAWQMQRQKGEVWLTAQGLDYLREDFHPKGLYKLINLDLVGYYVEFLRKAPNKASSEAVEPMADLDDAGILDLIKHLDKELGTENYLPMFHLREKLALPRDEFDQALYRLQRAQKIELSTLQETDAYTSTQIDAGIPQIVSGPLFFISLT